MGHFKLIKNRLYSIKSIDPTGFFYGKNNEIIALPHTIQRHNFQLD